MTLSRKPKLRAAVSRTSPVPQTVSLDVNLVIKAENARFQQADFSDSHWAAQILAAYRGACRNKAARLALALAEILRAFCVSSKAAKELAQEYSKMGAPIPSWVRLQHAPDEWAAVRKNAQKTGFKFGPQGEIIGVLHDGD